MWWWDENYVSKWGFEWGKKRNLKMQVYGNIKIYQKRLMSFFLEI